MTSQTQKQMWIFFVSSVPFILIIMAYLDIMSFSQNLGTLFICHALILRILRTEKLSREKETISVVYANNMLTSVCIYLRETA